MKDGKGQEVFLQEIIDKDWDNRDSVFREININQFYRTMGTTIEGTLIVGKIEKENGKYKVYSKTEVSQYTKPFFEIINRDFYKSNHRTLVVYFDIPDEKYAQEILSPSSSIYYKAKFNNLSDYFLVLTDGEVLTK